MADGATWTSSASAPVCFSTPDAKYAALVPSGVPIFLPFRSARLEIAAFLRATMREPFHREPSATTRNDGDLGIAAEVGTAAAVAISTWPAVRACSASTPVEKLTTLTSRPCALK